MYARRPRRYTAGRSESGPPLSGLMYQVSCGGPASAEPRAGVAPRANAAPAAHSRQTGRADGFAHGLAPQSEDRGGRRDRAPSSTTGRAPSQCRRAELCRRSWERATRRENSRGLRHAQDPVLAAAAEHRPARRRKRGEGGGGPGSGELDEAPGIRRSRGPRRRRASSAPARDRAPRRRRGRGGDQNDGALRFASAPRISSRLARSRLFDRSSSSGTLALETTAARAGRSSPAGEHQAGLVHVVAREQEGAEDLAGLDLGKLGETPSSCSPARSGPGPGSPCSLGVVADAPDHGRAGSARCPARRPRRGSAAGWSCPRRSGR